jgi:hypothetical protein
MTTTGGALDGFVTAITDDGWRPRHERIEGHRSDSLALLEGIARAQRSGNSSIDRTLSGDQNGAYRSQKAVDIDDRLANCDTLLSSGKHWLGNLSLHTFCVDTVS